MLDYFTSIFAQSSVQVKDPLEWSLNEAQKKLIFPGLESELEKIAAPLEPPLENDQFDELDRFYYIYLIVSVEGADNLIVRNIVSKIYPGIILYCQLISFPGTTYLVHYTRRKEDIPVGHKWLLNDRRVVGCGSDESWV